jgi:hypothetical protein
MVPCVADVGEPVAAALTVGDRVALASRGAGSARCKFTPVQLREL